MLSVLFKKTGLTLLCYRYPVWLVCRIHR